MDEYEQKFFDLCGALNWVCNKIEPQLSERTMDFLVSNSHGKFLAEVTHIQEELTWECGTVYSRTVGKKVRNVIDKKRTQVRSGYESSQLPCLIMIYDSTNLIHTERHDICAALFGALTVSINKTTLESSMPFHGKNAKIREGHNTFISAIGVNNKFQKRIQIYHNPYADVSLEGYFANNDNFDEVAFFIEN